MDRWNFLKKIFIIIYYLYYVRQIFFSFYCICDSFYVFYFWLCEKVISLEMFKTTLCLHNTSLYIFIMMYHYIFNLARHHLGNKNNFVLMS